jgi:hypothetical protein
MKMSQNQEKILRMLADGKIKVDEAQRLLALVDTEGERESVSGSADGKKSAPRYMHVIVEPKAGVTRGHERHDYHKVNVRVPFGLIRAGIKLATLIPSGAAEHVDRAFKEKGLSFDIRKLKEEDLEEMVNALHDSEVNVDTEYETVRVYAE